MQHFLTRDEVKQIYAASSWQQVIFSEFEAALTSRSRPFPCVFGVTGFKGDQLRFCFLDPLTPRSLAPILRAYLAEARGFGKMTSLVVFDRPKRVLNMEQYREGFWSLLDGLVEVDHCEWVKDVAKELDTASWEFCFAGEPMFVVCNSLAHILRQSRRASTFMVTFQPRWVFEGITDTDDPAILRSLERVRTHLRTYDAIPASPMLGKYGNPDNREFSQYFLADTNLPAACPFTRMGVNKENSDRESAK